MAEGKNSFVAYADWKEVFDDLTNEDAGILIKHVFAYVNDENPQSDNPLIKAHFLHIKGSLKRDLKKWENTKDKKSEAGIIGNLKRWNNDLYLQYKSEEISLAEALIIAEHRRTSHSDNPSRTPSRAVAEVANIAVSDSVPVSVNVSVTEEKSTKKKPPVFSPPKIEEVELYFIEEGYTVESAQKFYKYYDSGNWHDSKNKPIRNWKQKAQGVWFKDDNKSSMASAPKKSEDGKIFIPAFNIHISPMERAAWQKNWIGRLVTSGIDLNDQKELSSWLVSNERSLSDIPMMKDHLQTFKDYFNVEA